MPFSPLLFTGLGLVAAFVGLILQLVHELDKNVYIVNPERVKAWMCGLSKRNGLLVLGLLLVGIQVIEELQGVPLQYVICAQCVENMKFSTI